MCSLCFLYLALFVWPIFHFFVWFFLEFQITKVVGLTKSLFCIYSSPSKVGLFAPLFVSFLQKISNTSTDLLFPLYENSVPLDLTSWLCKRCSLPRFPSKNHGHCVMWSLPFKFLCTVKGKGRRIFPLIVLFAFLINHLSQRAAVFYWTACVM